MRKDSVSGTFFIAAMVCIVCSVLVSTTAVKLRPEQDYNREIDRQKNILEAAGMMRPGINIEQVFRENISARLVNLETGEFISDELPEGYDQRLESRDPNLSSQIPSSLDVAGIKRRAARAPVYLVMKEGQVIKLILPVYGKGLWSTMYGFLALESDTKTVAGITYYEHGETPGLGGEIDNPRWKQSWTGKEVFDDQWQPSIQVIKGSVDLNSPNAKHQIDGLSGATITARGVMHTMQYWLSDQGYGRFLTNFRSRSQTNG